MNQEQEQVKLHVGEIVETEEGDIGVIIALYPIFELGTADYYVQINSDIEIYPAHELTPVEL